MSTKVRYTYISLSLASLVSGVALVISLISNASLGLLLLLLTSFASILFSFRCMKATMSQRATIRQRLFTGLLAGIAATAAYDLSRWLLVTMIGWQFWPFESFPLFGRLIAGESVSQTTAYITTSI